MAHVVLSKKKKKKKLCTIGMVTEESLLLVIYMTAAVFWARTWVNHSTDALGILVRLLL